MDITIFLAKIWGPLLLALGLGFWLNRSYYQRLYRDMEKETLAGVLYAMFGIAAGIIHITFHNTWGTLPEFLISLFGWGMLIKGVLMAIIPRSADRWGNWVSHSKMLPWNGTIIIIIGLYVSWFAYFS